MFVSLEHKAIFLHNPKCAGASISRALKSNWGFKPAWKIVTSSFLPAHQHQKNIPTQWQQYHIFCVVRYPYDRFISEWEYRVSQGTTDLDFSSYLWGISTILRDYGTQYSYAVQCDRVFSFETIAKSNFQGGLPLPFGDVEFGNFNSTPRRFHNWWDYYSTLDEFHLYEQYQEDFEKLGYPKYKDLCNRLHSEKLGGKE